eukprot:scaffold210619_cov28-Tisochrysis_lutea.AAC.4
MRQPKTEVAHRRWRKGIGEIANGGANEERTGPPHRLDRCTTKVGNLLAAARLRCYLRTYTGYTCTYAHAPGVPENCNFASSPAHRQAYHRLSHSIQGNVRVGGRRENVVPALSQVSEHATSSPKRDRR